MKESFRTYISGVRTSAVQYEVDRPVLKKVEESRPVCQPVRQGNKKYSVSPIYSKKSESDVAETIPSYTIDEIRVYQQEAPALMPTELIFGQSEISDEMQYGQMQESDPTLVRRKPTSLSDQKQE